MKNFIKRKWFIILIFVLIFSGIILVMAINNVSKKKSRACVDQCRFSSRDKVWIWGGKGGDYRKTFVQQKECLDYCNMVIEIK